MVLLALAVGGVLAAAWWRDRSSNRQDLSTAAGHRTPRSVGFFAFVVLAGLFGAALGALLWLPATSAQVAEKLGFVAYVAFYSLTPIVMPSPNPMWFSPPAATDAIPGLVALTAIASALAIWRQQIGSRPRILFLLIFVGAALLPVSSMVGGLRYLYLSSAGIALLGGALLQRVTGGARRAAWLAFVAVLVVSASQIVIVGRTWRWAAAVTRDGVILMSEAARPCGTKDVVLLTTPAGIGDVYGNVYYEAFDVLDRMLASRPPDAASRGAHRRRHHRDQPATGRRRDSHPPLHRKRAGVGRSQELRLPGRARVGSVHRHRGGPVDDVP